MSAKPVNRQFLLAARPKGMVKESDLKYAEAPVPSAGNGEVLIRTRYLSLDPSMRGQMENRADYVAPLQIGDVIHQFFTMFKLTHLFSSYVNNHEGFFNQTDREDARSDVCAKKTILL